MIVRADWSKKVVNKGIRE